MKEKKNWIIIDVKRSKPLYGFNGKTLEFSSRDIAEEIAIQLYEQRSGYLLLDISKL